GCFISIYRSVPSPACDHTPIATGLGWETRYRSRPRRVSRRGRGACRISRSKEIAMTATAAVPGLQDAPTSHARLLAWVSEVAALTTPDRVVWCDGSPEEWTRLTDELVAAGTLVRLDDRRKPNSLDRKSVV